MNRLLVLGLVGTNIGGIETFLLNMNDAMDKECIFDYVIEEKKCIHLSRINNRGGKVYKIPNRKFQPFGNAIGFYKLIKLYNYKTVYFNVSSLSWIALEIIALFCGLRVIVHSHNAGFSDANSSFAYKVMNSVNRVIINNIGIEKLACSDYAAQFMFGKRKDYLVINNGIFADKFVYREDKRKKWRNIYGLQNDLVIGFTGRLEYQKNPIFAIDIFYEMRKRKKCKFLIVGDGALANKVKFYAKKLGLSQDVIFVGNTMYVNELYSAMDFFLFPSKNEGLGIVLIEAQANGLQGITSDGVVPGEAFLTDLIEKESLSKSSREWADHCWKMIEKKTAIDRCSYNLKVVQRGFDIGKESRRLQKILFDVREQ